MGKVRFLLSGEMAKTLEEEGEEEVVVVLVGDVGELSSLPRQSSLGPPAWCDCQEIQKEKMERKRAAKSYIWHWLLCKEKKVSYSFDGNTQSPFGSPPTQGKAPI